jgi:N-acetylglucosaminyl-diphospho-decaprenol L-rhamnosyltransferase
VFVMNPDCRLRPDTLHRLAKSLPQPGRPIAVPRLVDPGRSLQPFLRRSPTVGRALAEVVIGGDPPGRIGTLGELIVNPREYDHPGQAVWATGAAMLPSADAIRDLGPWDESFLLYREETEYCLRAADHGWTLWYEPAAAVEHIGGELGTNPALFAPMLVANKVKLFPTHATPPVIDVFSIPRRDGLSSATSAPREVRRPARAAGAAHRTGSRTTSRSSSARRVRSRPARRRSGRRRCE